MSDTMLFGVLRMSFEMAMKDRSTQFQYWQRGQEAAEQIERLLRGREFLSQALNDANDWGLELQTENERLREALQKIAISDIDRPVARQYRPDGTSSKMDRCHHGIAMYDECTECVADFARSALKGNE